MGTTLEWEALRELASFRAPKGCAISLYLNLDPALTPTVGDVSTRVNSLVSELGRHASGEHLKNLGGDIDRIRAYFELELDRGGARGLALFASSADNLWQTFALPEPVPDLVKVGSELYVAPLVPLVGGADGALVAVVGRGRGELHRLRGGRLEWVADHTEPTPGRHEQGGWSQERYQRHIEHLVHAHLVRVADELDDRVRGGSRPVVVVTTEETRAAFADHCSAAVDDAIAGWASAEAHAGPAELLAAAEPILADWRAAEEERMLSRWREETGRNGRAAAGWEPTLEAASDGRVELLLYRNGVQRSAWRCPECGRVAARDGVCPLDGTNMEPSEDGLDLAVHQTLSNGGGVRAVTVHRDLDPVEGIGALLRY